MQNSFSPEDHLNWAQGYVAQCFASSLPSRARPARFISGVAVSSLQAVTNSEILPETIDYRLPVVLLLEHNLSRPIGRVTDISVDKRRGQMYFRAEIITASWMEPIWDAVVNQQMQMASIHVDARGTGNNPGLSSHRRLREISLCEYGSDAGAVIKSCWTDSGSINLRGPSKHYHFGGPTK